MEAAAFEIWSFWWVWGLGAIALLVLEIFAPGFLFLGFGAGAAVVAVLLGLGLLPSSLPILALTFACVSMASWFAMRRMFGVRVNGVKIWDKDINDDV
jgi:membrane protein implicated in regulation of membrane protease activity